MTRKQVEQKRYFNQIQRASERELDRQTTMLIRQMVLDLHSRLEEVVDYRSGNSTYDLNVLLSIVFIGLLLGENDIKNIENALECHPSKVNSWLAIAGDSLPGIPSDTTLLRALWNTVPVDLVSVVVEWATVNIMDPDLRKHLAIDGKANRACTNKCGGSTNPPYILNCFVEGSDVPYGQIEVGAKTNELGMLPDLLHLISLKGTYVTMDAAGTNAGIMQQVVSAGGHMIMPLKANQPYLAETVRAFMGDVVLECPESVSHFSDPDNGMHLHGRVSCRDYYVVTDNVEDILQGTSFEGIAHAVGMARRVNYDVHYDTAGNRILRNTSSMDLYFLMDCSDISAEEFAGFVRNHWSGCEVIHYTLDTEFAEDRSRLNTGYGMQNFSLLRKAALALLKYIQLLVKNLSFHGIRTILDQCGGIPSDVLRDTSSDRTRNTA